MSKKSAESVLRVVDYSKRSGAVYNAEEYEAAYQTVQLGDEAFVGHRDVFRRFTNVPYDFTGKSVVDFGCNTGGMLHHLADKIELGIGLDYDYRCVNAANMIKRYNQSEHLHFFTLDLDKDEYGLIRDMCLTESVDICFMLSISAWVKNWRKLMAFCTTIAPTLMYEAHGMPRFQKKQIAELYTHYSKVTPIPSEEADRHGRQVFLCENEQLKSEADVAPQGSWWKRPPTYAQGKLVEDQAERFGVVGVVKVVARSICPPFIWQGLSYIRRRLFVKG